MLTIAVAVFHSRVVTLHCRDSASISVPSATAIDCRLIQLHACGADPDHICDPRAIPRRDPSYLPISRCGIRCPADQ